MDTRGIQPALAALYGITVTTVLEDGLERHGNKAVNS